MKLLPIAVLVAGAIAGSAMRANAQGDKPKNTCGGGITLDPDDRVSFTASPIDHPNGECVLNPSDPTCAVSQLRVYHPDASTWVVRVEPPFLGSHRVWGGGNAGYVFVGHEAVPFEITAVRK